MTPHSLEAERAVLGAILLRPNLIAEVQAIVSPHEFYGRGHKDIFDSMAELDSRGQPPDPLTVGENLKLSGSLSRLEGGGDYLISLLKEVPSTERVGYYARIVAQRARQRELIALCIETANKAKGEIDADELLSEVEQAVFKLGSRSAQEQTLTLRDVLNAGVVRLEKRKAGELAGLPTGFADLDFVLGGLCPDDLALLAARPRMGKTALALGVLMNCGRAGIPCLMYSLEMGIAQLGDRAMAGAGKVDLAKIRGARLGTSDWANLVSGIAKIQHLPLEFDFSGELTVQAIRARTRRWAARTKNPGLVVVDYVQLVNVAGRKKETREQEVAAISKGLKALAKEIHMPVLALAQVSRKVDERPDKRPTLSDLRESGSLEQDADVTMFLYRDEVYNQNTDRKGIAEVIVAKNRQGAEGVAELRWCGDFTVFETLERAAPSWGRDEEEYDA